MSPPRTPDPPFAGRFEFSVGGVSIGTFTEVSGLSVEVGVEEIPEGGQNQFTHKVPGQMKWSNIVLKSGVTKSDELFAFLSKSSGDRFPGKLERQDGRIAVCDATGNPVREWNLVGAFAVRWTGPTLAASSSDLAVEELEIAHHGFSSGAG